MYLFMALFSCKFLENETEVRGANKHCNVKNDASICLHMRTSLPSSYLRKTPVFSNQCLSQFERPTLPSWENNNTNMLRLWECTRRVQACIINLWHIRHGKYLILEKIFWVFGLALRQSSFELQILSNHPRETIFVGQVFIIAYLRRQFIELHRQPRDLRVQLHQLYLLAFPPEGCPLTDKRRAVINRPYRWCEDGWLSLWRVCWCQNWVLRAGQLTLGEDRHALNRKHGLCWEFSGKRAPGIAHFHAPD